MRSFLYTTGAALLGCAALWQATDGFAAITAESARRLSVAKAPRPVPDTVLETMFGQRYGLAQQGVTLVEFIYTTCPTLCQTSGGDFAELRDYLAAAGLAVPMVSVSFDPAVDDVAALRDYGEIHSASGDPWTIARPNARDLPGLLETFMVTVIPDHWGGYEHNIAVLLIDANGAFAGAFDTRAFAEIRAAIETLQ